MRLIKGELQLRDFASLVQITVRSKPRHTFFPFFSHTVPYFIEAVMNGSINIDWLLPHESTPLSQIKEERQMHVTPPSQEFLTHCGKPINYEKIRQETSTYLSVKRDALLECLGRYMDVECEIKDEAVQLIFEELGPHVRHIIAEILAASLAESASMKRESSKVSATQAKMGTVSEVDSLFMRTSHLDTCYGNTAQKMIFPITSLLNETEYKPLNVKIFDGVERAKEETVDEAVSDIIDSDNACSDVKGFFSSEEFFAENLLNTDMPQEVSYRI
ncbi:hypothetical protein DICVIV_10821 [Dictyocaulus viviparus]|uniref:Uncharacterized protein n=1 Tax=Dictyocaulus viviparus TaxID=29172 RepID=A0A0D8XLC2_DICVI|nr:hypothetical protein DICVIV_10821 [Dictyocaulus viviparus]